ncbi:MAG: EAL domain-containing protein, partial [Gammaproteobacteria bacterium]|nr:EAL domain-containing protein [Gammaproteobacteria bacterium]
ISIDPDDAEIVNAVITMAHRLGLKVIAEGVESEAQLAHLREQQCDFAQGFLLSRPLPAAELEQLLRKWDFLSGPVTVSSGSQAPESDVLSFPDGELIGCLPHARGEIVRTLS